jgi:hypothetical protein
MPGSSRHPVPGAEPDIRAILHREGTDMMDTKNTSYVRKDSAMGKAALNAAGYANRTLGPGVLFTFDGRSYRVLSDTLDGLQSYMGYEDITGKESTLSQVMGRIARKPPGEIFVIKDFAEYARRFRIAKERGYRNPEKWAVITSNGIAMSTRDFQADHEPEPVAEASNATAPVNLSDILAAALVADAQACDCGHCIPDPDFAEVGEDWISVHSNAAELEAVLQAVQSEGFDIEDGAAVSVATAFKAMRGNIVAAEKTVASLTKELNAARREAKLHMENAAITARRVNVLEGTIDRTFKAVKAEFDKSDIIPF